MPSAYGRVVSRKPGDVLGGSRLGYSGLSSYYGDIADRRYYLPVASGGAFGYMGYGGPRRSVSAGCGVSYSSERGGGYRGWVDPSYGRYGGGGLRGSWGRRRGFVDGFGGSSYSSFGSGCGSGRRSSRYGSRRVRMPVYGRTRSRLLYSSPYRRYSDDACDDYFDDRYGLFCQWRGYPFTSSFYGTGSGRDSRLLRGRRFVVDDEWEDDDGWEDWYDDDVDDDLDSLCYLDWDNGPSFSGFDDRVDGYEDGGSTHYKHD
ncbi:uncharacterized protein PV09_00898 [Verruconis gallopava]|uniref:Uncharacterized protein n=1 Tax=Verruconis gallopava TaxID=253628 RepID=A0A0D2ARB2_9PEZI|nr:uncharacterized protein PV09_00898 [Verruconis gallopava]KIW09000.1 hypothetical protein PV09_00898 [Verruconis gallopava]